MNKSEGEVKLIAQCLWLIMSKRLQINCCNKFNKTNKKVVKLINILYMIIYLNHYRVRNKI